MTSVAHDPPPAESWFLRIEDGSVFGPVPARDLVDWAEQGRVLPGHKVSRDKADWQPAEALAFLAMDWTITLPDGRAYGPLNLRALADLVTDGTLQGSSPLADRRTGVAATVSQMRNRILGIAERLPPVSDAARQADAVARDAAAGPERAAGPQGSELAQMRGEAAGLTERALAAEGAAMRLREEAAQAQEAGRKAEASLRGELAALQQKFARAEAELKQAQSVVSTLKVLEEETEIDWINEKRVSRGPAHTHLLAERVELDARLRHANEELARLRHQVEQGEAASRDAAEALRHDHEAALQSLMDRLRGAEARAGELEAALRERDAALAAERLARENEQRGVQEALDRVRLEQAGVIESQGDRLRQAEEENRSLREAVEQYAAQIEYVPQAAADEARAQTQGLADQMAVLQDELQKALWAAERLDDSLQKAAGERDALALQLQESELRERQQRGITRGVIAELQTTAQNLELALQHQRARHEEERQHLAARIKELEQQASVLWESKVQVAEQLKLQTAMREREEQLRETRDRETAELRQQLARRDPTEVPEPEIVRIPHPGRKDAPPGFDLSHLEEQAEKELRFWRRSRQDAESPVE